jgi:hypothetical protein
MNCLKGHKLQLYCGILGWATVVFGYKTLVNVYCNPAKYTISHIIYYFHKPIINMFRILLRHDQGDVYRGIHN